MKRNEFIRMAVAMLKNAVVVCALVIAVLYWVGVALYQYFAPNAELAVPVVGFVIFLLPMLIGLVSVAFDDIPKNQK